MEIRKYGNNAPSLDPFTTQNLEHHIKTFLFPSQTHPTGDKATMCIFSNFLSPASRPKLLTKNSPRRHRRHAGYIILKGSIRNCRL